MKKIFLLSVLLLNLMISFAQSGKELLTLDNYLIPVNKKGAVIGKILTRPGEKVSLKNPSNIFTINKEGYIALKKNISITEKSPEHFQITLHNNKGEKKVFVLVKDNFIRNKVIAHRGAWKNQDAKPELNEISKKNNRTGLRSCRI